MFNIFRSLYEWQYEIFLDLLSFTANGLLQLMSTDLEFFEKYMPVVVDLYDVFTAIGWALLLGNFVFQAIKSMMAGLGIESENPAQLLARTGIYEFLLLVSKQICLSRYV